MQRRHLLHLWAAQGEDGVNPRKLPRVLAGVSVIGRGTVSRTCPIVGFRGSLDPTNGERRGRQRGKRRRRRGGERGEVNGAGRGEEAANSEVDALGKVVDSSCTAWFRSGEKDRDAVVSGV